MKSKAIASILGMAALFGEMDIYPHSRREHKSVNTGGSDIGCAGKDTNKSKKPKKPNTFKKVKNKRNKNLYSKHKTA